MATDEKILARIHKLLALATSDNENEAANAAAKAQTMLMEYNISEDELNAFGNKDKEKVVEVRTGGRTNHNRSNWYNALAVTVSDANLCKILTSGSGLIWIGKKTNVEVAQYILENLTRDLTRICDLTWKAINYHQNSLPKISRVHGKTWKNNFYHGANQTIRERLRSNLIALKETPTINALVVHSDFEIKEYMNIHYPSLTYNKFTINRNSSGFEAGKAAGRAVQFRSGLGAGGNAGPKLLNKG